MPTTRTLLEAAQRLQWDAETMTMEEFEAARDAWLDAGDDKLARVRAWREAATLRRDEAEHQIAEWEPLVARAKRELERANDLALALLVAREEIGETPRVQGIARLQPNGGKDPVVVEREAEVPEAYRRPAVAPLDLDKIRAALLAGTPVPGCRLGERGRHVRWE